MRALFALLLCLPASAQYLAGGKLAGGSMGGVATVVHGAWVPMTSPPPSAIPTAGGAINFWFHNVTHDLFITQATGTFVNCGTTTPFGNHVYYADAATHTYTDITGNLPTGGCEQVVNIIPFTSGGTVLAATSSFSAGAFVAVSALAWNGSLGSPSWTRISLGQITAQNAIQNHAYAIRSDGTVIFCVQFCYGNSTAGSTTYSVLNSSGNPDPVGLNGVGFYYGTGKGAAPQPSSIGFVYAMVDVTIGGTEYFIGGGEGDGIQIGAFSWPTGYTSFTDLFALAGGYSHNLTAMAAGPTSILVQRDNASCSLNKIALPSMTVTNIPAAAGYTCFPNASIPIGGLQYMSGTGGTSTFIWAALNSTTRHLYLTTNDASTLTDLIPALMTASGCTANTASVNSMTDQTTIYQNCTDPGSGLKTFWQYTP